MAMGTTERVVLNDEMQKAKSVCADFRGEVDSFYSELENTIQTLFNSGFQGEAADGFKEFFDKNVAAFFSPGGTFDQFMAMFDKEGEGIFDSIENALINQGGLDPSLGENNRNVGQSEEANK